MEDRVMDACQSPHNQQSREKTTLLHLFSKSRLLRFLPLVLIWLLPLFFSFAGTSQTASASSIVSNAPVDLTTLNSEIDTASQSALVQEINTAESDGSQALILQINTPGGDIDAMQAMMTAELTSTVPIISYISPAGAYGASAGALVTLAAQIAAMAPTTTIGASSPVNSDGSDLGATLKAKVESVMATDVTNVQQLYGRNVPLAVKMITNASSYGDQQAKELGIVDISASSLNDLLHQVNGRVVRLASGKSVTLQTVGASVRDVNPGLENSLYTLLIDPNVLFLLFVVAMIGLFVELSHPGLILPGILGSLALVLFLFGAGTLSPNWAGFALMMLALLLLVLDVRLSTHGVLTIGAVISLIIGSLLFFNSGGASQSQQLNPVEVYIAAGLIGLLGFYIVSIVLRTRHHPVVSGTEGMIGTTVTALTSLLPEGRVSYGGEDWAAVLDPPTLTVDAGSELRIISVEGLRLHVQLAATTLPPTDRIYVEGI
jgi:membrane-bound serine protease (ClpP class)